MTLPDSGIRISAFFWHFRHSAFGIRHWTLLRPAAAVHPQVVGGVAQI
jgi:hypothetical protein